MLVWGYSFWSVVLHWHIQAIHSKKMLANHIDDKDCIMNKEPQNSNQLKIRQKMWADSTPKKMDLKITVLSEIGQTQMDKDFDSIYMKDLE